MRVPARVFADAELLEAILADRSLEQLAERRDAARDRGGGARDARHPPGLRLPGRRRRGDGAPGRGRLARRRRLRHQLRRAAARPAADRAGARRRGASALVHELSRAIPAGTGKAGRASARRRRARRGAARRARALLVDALGIGTRGRPRAHRVGRLPAGCRPGRGLRARASTAGAGQLGTLGSGNHFVEVQRVERVFDPAAAEAFGLSEGQVTVLIHSGSRGLGHQVCTDYVRGMDAAQQRYGIVLPDRQLACAPQSSPEGRAYLAAMAAAANFAWANRQAMAHAVRERVRAACSAATRRRGDAPGLRRRAQHRQARALRRPRRARAPQGRDARVPRRLARDPGGVPRASGQPVFIPGSMGTSSFVLAGEPGSMERSFGTTCHGAGRAADPHRARASSVTRRRAPAAARGAGHRRPLPVEPGPRRGGAVRLQGRGARRRRRRAGRPRPPGRAARAARRGQGLTAGDERRHPEPRFPDSLLEAPLFRDRLRGGTRAGASARARTEPGT